MHEKQAVERALQEANERHNISIQLIEEKHQKLLEVFTLLFLKTLASE